MKYSLTLEQIDYWQQHHYLIINDYFDVGQKRELLEWVDEIIALPEAPQKWMKTYDFDGINSPRLARLEHFIEQHNRMSEMAQCSKLNTLLSTLMSEKVTLFQENIQFWYPHHQGSLPHQDAFELNTVGPSHHITMLIGLDKGLIHLPEHFKYQQKILAENNGQLTAKLINKTQWERKEYYTGDIVLLDSYLPYYIPPNESDLIRRAVFFSYNKCTDGGSKRAAFYQNKRRKQNPDAHAQDKKTYA